MKKNEALGIVLFLLGFLGLFSLITYASVDDFIYGDMAKAILIEKSGSVDLATTNNPGFRVLTVMVSLISNIPYDVLPTLPLQSIAVILLLMVIAKDLSHGKLLYIFLPAFYITTNAVSLFQWQAHGLGLILFFLILYVVILRARSKSANQQIATSLIMIIAIISLNFISYKITFVAITFIMSLAVICWMEGLRTYSKTAQASKFALIALIGTVFTLSFNQFFYNTLIPTMRFASEFSHLSGIEKLFLPFFPAAHDPLSEFYVRSPTGVVYGNMVRLVLILVSLILCAVILVRKFIRRERYSIGEKIVFACGITGTFILAIYTILGTFNTLLLVFTALLGYCIISQMPHRNYRRFAVISISLLLVLNPYTSLEGVGPVQDNHGFKHLHPTSEWIIENMKDQAGKTASAIVSDVFTRTYFMKVYAQQRGSILGNSEVFSRDHMSFLLRPDSNPLPNENNVEYRFVINYKLRRFATLGWENYESWSNFRQTFEMNPYLNAIYSTGYVVIYNTWQKNK